MLVIENIDWVVLLSVVLGSYLLGSIPVGYLFVRFVAGRDVREIGSGNIGATNVYRLLGLRYALAVFFLDMLKGLTPVAIVFFLAPQYLAYGIIFAVVGNVFSVFLGFKGGKGIATSAGALLIPLHIAVLSVAALGLIIIKFTRYVSVASLIIGFSLLGLTWFYFNEYVLTVAILLSLVVFAHRSNIVRIVRGKEKKITRVT
jgi:glycerol-3-phosphate acyltransferase PlsY